MIDSKNRLYKLLRACLTYDEFKEKAVYKASWYLSPYALSGHRVDKPWLENFWKAHKN